MNATVSDTPADSADFDAIVVGSGISGGWAAKELTEKGLRVLLLERGRDVEHGEGYISEHQPQWELPFHNKPQRQLYAEQYPVQSQSFVFDEGTRHFFNNDRDNPYHYDPEHPFNWIRADVVGGRSLLWGRQVYRWSDLDFQANAVDGHGIPWPIAYADVKDWYSHVERFIGVSGQAENLPQLPDGEFMPAMAMNTVEKAVKKSVEARYKDRRLTIGRVAVLTRNHNGRGQCHYCGPCERGCSVGAYFSSQSSTLPAARATGRLTLRPHSVVEKLAYDPDTRQISAVRVIDSRTRERRSFSAKLVFLCASTVASTQILLNSRSEAMPQGLANGSGVLGRYLMDHSIGLSAMGAFTGYEKDYYYGNRPNVVYMPRFRNLARQETDFLRGYGFQALARRSNWQSAWQRMPGFGADYKNSLAQPGPWSMLFMGFGECLPRATNTLQLGGDVDRFGIPQLSFNFAWSANELAMRRDMAEQAEAMLKHAGAAQTRVSVDPGIPGSGIHEMGTARMGDDPATSVLNRYNQAHQVSNLFVTDGSCMTSSSCVNPSLTYMALTARAVDYAVGRLQGGTLAPV